MRPNLALVLLLALLALGGTLYFVLGRSDANVAVEAAPPALSESQSPGKPADTKLLTPQAKAADELANAGRTAISAPPPAPVVGARAATTATLVGRVTDSVGQAIVGAEVRANLGDWDMPDFEAPGSALSAAKNKDQFRVKSDAAGKFEIGGIKPGSVRLSVRAPGFVPMNKSGIGIPAVERHDIGDLALETSVILEGRVLDSRGAAVGGARIARSSPDGMITFGVGDEGNGGPPPLATSAADGSFRIDQLASGPWRLSIASEEHPDKSESGTTKRPGERVSGLAFVLEDGVEIAGRVSGVPPASVADASVAAMPAAAPSEMIIIGTEEVSMGENRRRAKLAPDGSFAVKGLRQGSYQLQARVKSGKDAFWPRSASERVEAKSGDRGVLIAWQPASVLSFQVVDKATKAPIEELIVSAHTRAAMSFFDPNGEKPRRYENGLVQVDDLRPRDANDRATLEVSGTGYRNLKMGDIVLARGAQTDLGVLELERATTVNVRVVDSRTRGGIEKAKVELRPVSADSVGGRAIRVSRWISADNNSDEVSFDDGQSKSARTDAQGLARLNSIPGRKGKLTVTCDGYAPYTTEAFDMPADSDVDQNVALDQGGSVEITLLSAQGVPVSGARIDHRAPDANDNPFGDPFGGGKGAATDSAGKVTLANLAPGLHRFRPAKDSGGDTEGGMVFAAIGGMDGADQSWSEVEIVRGGTATLVLHEPVLAELKGHVREGGAVLAGARLSLSKRGAESPFEGMEDMPFGGGGPTAKSDGDGRYRFERIEAGSYELSVRHATRAMSARYPIEINESGLEYDIDLPITILEGRVLDGENKPVAGAKVWAERKRAGGNEDRRSVSVIGGPIGEGMIFDSSAGLDQSKAHTDADGRYLLRGVENDTDLEVQVDAKDCELTKSAPVSVALGQTKSGVDIVVVAAGQIQAKVAPVAGKPAGPCLVHAEYLDPLPAGKEIEPKTEFAQGGTAIFKSLRPGRWKLHAEGLGGFDGGDSQNLQGEPREVLVVAREVAKVELQLP